MATVSMLSPLPLADALAIAVGYWTERMAVDASRGIQKHKDALFARDLRDFMDHAGGTKSRAPRWMSVRGR